MMKLVGLPIMLIAIPTLAYSQGIAIGRDYAPLDITGNWVSLITDEWQVRMMTPVRGDYRYVPLNEVGQAIADRWDPERDDSVGESCKAYAAPAIMRLPSRLRISWQDDVTLRVDIDTGTQTRLFHFGEFSEEPPSWQGSSVAVWEPSGDAAAVTDDPSTALRVDTTNLRSGYLQKNGVPFSENTYMTEYFSLLSTDDGTQYLIVQIFVDDPTYLTDHWVRTATFRREMNDESWNQTPCTAY
jgi:hypothetical protein